MDELKNFKERKLAETWDMLKTINLLPNKDYIECKRIEQFISDLIDEITQEIPAQAETGYDDPQYSRGWDDCRNEIINNINKGRRF